MPITLQYWGKMQELIADFQRLISIFRTWLIYKNYDERLRCILTKSFLFTNMQVNIKQSEMFSSRIAASVLIIMNIGVCNTSNTHVMLFISVDTMRWMEAWNSPPVWVNRCCYASCISACVVQYSIKLWRQSHVIQKYRKCLPRNHIYENGSIHLPEMHMIVLPWSNSLLIQLWF